VMRVRERRRPANLGVDAHRGVDVRVHQDVRDAPGDHRGDRAVQFEYCFF